MSDPHSAIVVVDTHEQAPLAIEGYPVEVATLPVGDYGIKGFSNWDNPQFIIERKSLDDLVGSLTTGRDRFMREVEKLRAFRFHALVIEGVESEVALHHYRSAAKPESILSSLAALQVRTGLHVIWAGSSTGAARAVERLVRQFTRGIEKDMKRLIATGKEACTCP